MSDGVFVVVLAAGALLKPLRMIFTYQGRVLPLDDDDDEDDDEEEESSPATSIIAAILVHRRF